MPRLVLLCILLPGLASAQIYRWTDAQGRVHFGEKPAAGATPVEVRPQVIERDQATREREAGAARFFDARRQEQAAASEQAAEAAVRAAQQCADWQQQRQQLQGGRVFFRTAENGERTYYSDAEVATARRQLETLISERCR